MSVPWITFKHIRQFLPLFANANRGISAFQCLLLIANLGKELLESYPEGAFCDIEEAWTQGQAVQNHRIKIKSTDFGAGNCPGRKNSSHDLGKCPGGGC